MSTQSTNQMFSAQKLEYLASREQVFGWRRDHRGLNFDVKSAEFAQRAATQLIALGQKNGLLTRDGSEKDIRIVQHALDSRALNGAWKWVNSAEQGIRSEARPEQVQTQPVEHLVNMARRHGAHGFRGDPKKEVAADNGSDVLALAASVGLNGFTSPETAPIAAPFTANDNRSSDNDDGSDVLALAAAAGLKGFAQPKQPAGTPTDTPPGSASRSTKADADDGSDVLALARAFGLKGFV